MPEDLPRSSRRSGPSSIASPGRTRSWRARPRPSCRRSSPRRGGPASLHRRAIRSTRPIWCRRSRWCRRRGPTPGRWSSAPRLIARHRPGAHRHEAGDRRLRHEPHAGRPAAGGLPPGRRGLCTAEDIDIGIRDGLGLRWSFMGPFETIDFNAPGGVRDYVARYERSMSACSRRCSGASMGGPVLDDDRDAARRASCRATGWPSGSAGATAG